MLFGIAQLNPTIGQLQANSKAIIEAYHALVQQGADLVITPELALSGYPPKDLVFRGHFVEDNEACVEAIAKEVGPVPLILGHVRRRNSSSPGRPFENVASVIVQGKVVAVRAKTLLPTYDVFDEHRYFEPAQENLPVVIHGKKLGITICEDIWFDQTLYHQNPVKSLIEHGAEIIVNLSASPYHAGKPNVRRQKMAQLARDYSVPILYANAVGGNDELIFDGHSFATTFQGDISASLPGFEEATALVSLEQVISLPTQEPMEEIYQALILGLRDYARKCGFLSAVLGLSGGIDSALVAVLAAEAFGKENVLGITMPSPFSTDGSKSDSYNLAKNLEIRCETLPISSPFEHVLATLDPLFEGKPRDVTEENIQARLRGLLLMAVSNKFGHLLLTTGNKSELAVGYCTIYGDMCGGLAVISDLPKTKVFELARWINRDREIIPWNTINKAPSAELRPDQKDQDTLPPYDVLDGILECLIEEQASIQETVARGFEEETVRWVQHRIETNEWKRNQAAPGLRVTQKAFGSGRRIPLAQRYRES